MSTRNLFTKVLKLALGSIKEWLKHTEENGQLTNPHSPNTRKQTMNSDRQTLARIKKLGISVELKNMGSFQLHLDQGNVMFYTSIKRGDFLYVPWSKQRIYVDSVSTGLLKAIDKVRPKDEPRKVNCPFCGDTGKVNGDGDKLVPCKTLNKCLIKGNL